jgi:hypothetical protein
LERGQNVLHTNDTCHKKAFYICVLSDEIASYSIYLT